MNALQFIDCMTGQPYELRCCSNCARFGVGYHSSCPHNTRNLREDPELKRVCGGWVCDEDENGQGRLLAW